MKFIIYGFLSLFLWSASAIAVECTELSNSDCTATSGCYYITGSCLKCPDDYPYSDDNRSNITTCYKSCLAQNITNGKIGPDSPKIYYPEENTNPSSCTYTKKKNITCETNPDACLGYYLNPELTSDTVNAASLNTACISNVTNFLDDGIGTGFTVHDSPTKYYQTCTAEQTHYEYASTKCGKNYGYCYSDTKTCNAAGLQNCDGTIQNNAIWKENKWDYSDCTCQNSSESDIRNGTGKLECKYSSGGTENTSWSSTNCAVYELISCTDGYCQTDDTKLECKEAPKGHYSEKTNTKCERCPMGSTSNAGARSKSQCHITSGTNGTQFCDNNGCFTLPGSTKYSAN